MDQFAQETNYEAGPHHLSDLLNLAVDFMPFIAEAEKHPPLLEI